MWSSATSSGTLGGEAVEQLAQELHELGHLAGAEHLFPGFGDVTVEIEWLVASGNEGAAGVTVRATHTADMPLPDGTVIPARGTRIELHTAEHIRVDGDGKIVEHQRYTDSAAFLAQLMPTAPVS